MRRFLHAVLTLVLLGCACACKQSPSRVQGDDVIRIKADRDMRIHMEAASPVNEPKILNVFQEVPTSAHMQVFRSRSGASATVSVYTFGSPAAAERALDGAKQRMRKQNRIYPIGNSIVSAYGDAALLEKVDLQLRDLQGAAGESRGWFEGGGRLQ